MEQHRHRRRNGEIAALVLVTVLGAASAGAKTKPDHCRDASGQFIKCQTAASQSTGQAPVCKVGKPCGKSCIAKDKVCHK